MNTLYKKALLSIAALLVLVAAILLWQSGSRNSKGAAYRTGEVVRDDLLVSISATGTVEPEEVIDVGAQVAGRILSFGRDARGKPVDYGSMVEAGTVLARIDDSLYAAEVAQAEAQLLASKAGLLRARADLERAERDWLRARTLGPSEALSQSSYDAYESAYKTALAQVAVNEAEIGKADAALARARRNLGYTTITSPVKGIIIDRRVNIGQTVVASLNAPSLFLIAKDLTRIQVWVAVNEADIGRIHPGLPVSFTVDAFPGETFRGEVGKIRLNASMTQNVVTYTVEIITDNSNGRLLPYLTANVIFELKTLSKVLQVPNAALRWSPPEAGEGGMKPGATKPEGMKKQATKEEKPASAVWVLDEGKPKRVEVSPGLSDGIMTSVRGEGIEEGMQVITGLRVQTDAKGSASNPFTPQFARGTRNSGSGQKQ
ncbi:efflux RND transporter periplasmic adaptor subunit [Thiovibrio sp. JS02]